MRRDDYQSIFQQQVRFLEKSCLDFDKGEENEAIRIAGHLRTVLHDSYTKKDFDSKLPTMVYDLTGMLQAERLSDGNKVLNALNGIKIKIDQQQKTQILSKSLLTQLDQKSKLLFLDTSLPRGAFAFYTMGGVSHTIITSRSYYGLLAKEIETAQDDVQMVKYQPLCLHPLSSRYFKTCKSLPFDEWWRKIIYNSGSGVSFSRRDLVIMVANQDGYAHIEENVDERYLNFKDANILENFINDKTKEKSNLATLCSVRQIAYEVLATIKNAI